MKKRILSSLLALCMVLTLLPGMAFAAGEITTEEALTTAIEAGGTVTLGGDIALSKVLAIKKDVVIDGAGHTLSASENFSGTTNDTNHLIEINGFNVTLKNITVNANKKCYVIRAKGNSHLTLENATITGGKVGSDSVDDYIAGIYVTGNSVFKMSAGSAITGNVIEGNYANDNYLQYSADLWIGANATGEITEVNGTVGNLFVNANEYSANNPGSCKITGGKITNVYVEYDKGYGASFIYTGGTIDNLYLSTTTAGTSTKVTPVVGTTYKGGSETFAVSFDTAGGSTTPAQQIIQNGGKVNKPTDPTKDGYTFAGWFKEGATAAYDFNTEVTESFTLTAHWEEETPSTERFTVSFYDDISSSNPLSTQTIDSGSMATRPTTDPTKPGYIFAGWYYNQGVSVNDLVPYNFKQPVTRNLSLYAQWQVYVAPPVVTPTPPANTETTTNPDGSTTTTVEKPDGTVTETTKAPDGSKTEVVTKPDGSQTTSVKDASGMTSTTVVDAYGQVEAEVSLPKKVADAAAESGETVALPMPPVYAGYSADAAPVVNVDLPKNADAVAVEIPVARPSAGTVAVIVHADGTEEIVKTSVSTDTGVVVTLDGDATLKIVDNTKSFVDKPNDWSTESIDFVTSRELFNGTSATTFSPEATMTREMLMTVLARLDGADTTGDALAKGMEWAVSVGISDGSNAKGEITREQLAVMLYRYAGQPVTYGGVNGFVDADAVSGFAADAMAWAVECGIVGGMDGKLNPQGSATRAQVAAMLQRFVEQ